MLNYYHEREEMSSSQVEYVNKQLDEPIDIDQEKELPSLELEKVFLVGKRDKEVFLEPYNRAVAKTLEIFQ